MKSIQAIRFLVLVSMLLAGALQAAPVTVMPGLTYYDGPEKLTGKLVFLIHHDYQVESNSEIAASIYEFDLAAKTLHEITKAPRGSFLSSTNGELYCVNYWSGIYQKDYGRNINNQTNLFVYSKLTKEIKIVDLKYAPMMIKIVGDRILARFDDVVYRGYTNIFEYNITSGRIAWLVKMPDDQQDNCKYFNGVSIGFRGIYDPIEPEGFTLVTDSGKKLHRFSWFHDLFHGDGSGGYTISQMSPDRHFAVVKLGTRVKRKAGEDYGVYGSGNTYYLVDVSTGKTRVLIQDELEAKSTASLCPWGIRWVQ